MPYFCGQQDECSVLQSKWALETAKANIEHWYPVVGILEDLQMTLFVLENKLPLFFKGASHIYFNELKEPHKNRGKPRRSLPREARQFLQQKLSHEYELYIFAKQRLKRQQRELKLWKLKTQTQRKSKGKIKKIKVKVLPK
jgi:dermatan/chondrotin sulfate uronyl 2-O-sulfotransferase UST